MILPTRRKILIAAAFIAGASVSGISSAHADDSAKAESFIQDLANKAITLLSDDDQTLNQKEVGFRTLIDDKVDFERIGYFALAKYRRTADKSALATFNVLFKEYAIRIYESRLSEYGGQQLAVTGSIQANKKDIIVESLGQFPDFSKPLEINWRVRNKGSIFVIIDIQVVGVWMALEQREQFTSILSQNKGDLTILNEYLEEQLER